MSHRLHLAARLLADLERVPGSYASKSAVDWYCLTLEETKRMFRADMALMERMRALVDWVEDYEEHSLAVA